MQDRPFRNDLQNSLIGYWPGSRSPTGHLWDRSPEKNHGVVGFDARWIWFTNPRAIHHVGKEDKTYVGYLGGPTGTDIQIGSYDHTTGSLTRTTLQESFSSDDHTNPSIHVRGDGHVLAFWTGHNGEAIHYAVSTHPEDVSTFESRRSIDGDCVTYPNPIRASPEEADEDLLCLFYRDRVYTEDTTDDKYGYMGDGNVYYRTSSDGGETWSDQTQFLQAKSGHYGTYFVHATAADGTIHFFVTDAERGGDAPKHHVMHLEIYDGSCYRADGTRLAGRGDLPLSVEELPVIYDSSAPGNHSSWVWDAGVDSDGNPAVVYATFPSTLSHEYRYARWDGSTWQDFHVADAGRHIEEQGVELHYSAGIAMDADDPDVLYACFGPGESADLTRLETDTGGRTWAATDVTDRVVGTQLRPVVPQNASDEIPVLWLAGWYPSMHSSQTVLRGLPTDSTGGSLEVDGSRGVSLGAHRYESHHFSDGVSDGQGASDGSSELASDGVSLSMLLRVDARTNGTVMNFGGALRLDVARSTNDAVECSLSSSDEHCVTSWSGVTVGDWQFVEGCWDGETFRLLVEGEIVDEQPFEGPLVFEEGTGWTLCRDAHLMGAGFNGALREVRLYNRPTTQGESHRLAELARNAGQE